MFFTTSLFAPSKFSLDFSEFLMSVSSTACPVSPLTPPSKWVSLKMTSSGRVLLFCSWLLLYLFNGKVSPDTVDICFVFMTSSCWYISVGTSLPLIFANLSINRLASLVLLLLISHLRDSGKNLAKRRSKNSIYDIFTNRYSLASLIFFCKSKIRNY